VKRGGESALPMKFCTSVTGHEARYAKRVGHAARGKKRRPQRRFNRDLPCLEEFSRDLTQDAWIASLIASRTMKAKLRICDTDLAAAHTKNNRW